MVAVAVVGASGAVGRKVLSVLERERFALESLHLFGSPRSAGQTMVFREGTVQIAELTPETDFSRIKICIMSAGSGVSKRHARHIAEQGCVVIDNSSAWRAAEDVPLVVPEINGATLLTSSSRLIANPNCTTAITLMPLAPLHAVFGVRRIAAASYQAVSGAGQRGVEQLAGEIDKHVRRRFTDPEEVIDGSANGGLDDGALPEPLSDGQFAYPIAFNVIPQIGEAEIDCFTTEELKMEAEARKILEHPTFRADATCVRVPVYTAHTVAVTAQFKRRVSAQAARDILSKAPGVIVLDDPANNIYPTPRIATGRFQCFVGRIREGRAFPNSLCFVVSGDQLLKGAALNAVQIAQLVRARM